METLNFLLYVMAVLTCLACTVLLAACSKPEPTDTVESLVANPERLKDVHGDQGDASALQPAREQARWQRHVQHTNEEQIRSGGDARCEQRVARRVPLRLNALHPDGAAGLGFLSGSAFALQPLLLAQTVALSGILAGKILHEGAALPQFKLEIAAWMLFLILLALALAVALLLPLPFLAALAMIFVRRLTATETTASIVVYFSATATAGALLSVPFGWMVPPPGVLAVLVLAGILGGVGQILMTESYRHAEASVIATFEYTSMVWSLLFAMLLFDERPGPPVLIGMAIVVAAGLLVIARERRSRRPNAT